MITVSRSTEGRQPRSCRVGADAASLRLQPDLLTGEFGTGLGIPLAVSLGDGSSRDDEFTDGVPRTHVLARTTDEAIQNSPPPKPPSPHMSLGRGLSGRARNGG